MAIPLVLCGKIEASIKGLSASLAPEYDIIHVCRTTEDATSEVPSLLKGNSVKPASGFGSNVDKSTPTSGTEVKAVIIGGGYGPEDYEAIKKAVDAVKAVPFLKADMSKPRPAGVTGPPGPAELKQRVSEALEEAKGKDWAPGLYAF